MTRPEVQEQLRVLQNRAKRRIMALENALAAHDYQEVAVLSLEAMAFLDMMNKNANHERLRAMNEDAGWGAGMDCIAAAEEVP